MTGWPKRLFLGAALAFLVLTFVNASWLAPDPLGSPKLIAHRGVAQIYDQQGVGRDTCTADRIEQPVHDYLENTTRSMIKAQRNGAQMVEVDIAATADGEIAIFHDWTLDCRTDGNGNIRDATMEELQALDIGFGYSADGGETYPFRGQGVGAMPTLEEALAALPRTGIMFNFKSADPAEADLLAQRLIASGRDVERYGDGFYGNAAPIARMQEHFPENWAFDPDAARECTEDYVMLAWTGYVPQSCRGGTLIVPLDQQWPIWGWPNRAIARMEAHDGRILVVGPIGLENGPRGLVVPEQLTEIPNSFNGYVWVEDIWTIGPALWSSMDSRDQAERDAAQAGLEARRTRLGLE